MKFGGCDLETIWRLTQKKSGLNLLRKRKISFWRGFWHSLRASNPEHIVMKTYEIYQKNSQKLSKWSPSPGFSVVQKYAIKYLLALTEPFFVA